MKIFDKDLNEEVVGKAREKNCLDEDGGEDVCSEYDWDPKICCDACGCLEESMDLSLQIALNLLTWAYRSCL